MASCTSWTVDEAIRMLEQVRDEVGGDTPILIATQPSWPLALQISDIRVRDENTDLDAEASGEYAPDDAESEEPDEKNICWIVVSNSHPEGMSPYAHKDLWI